MASSGVHILCDILCENILLRLRYNGVRVCLDLALLIPRFFVSGDMCMIIDIITGDVLKQ